MKRWYVLGITFESGRFVVSMYTEANPTRSCYSKREFVLGPFSELHARIVCAATQRAYGLEANLEHQPLM